MRILWVLRFAFAILCDNTAILLGPPAVVKIPKSLPVVARIARTLFVSNNLCNSFRILRFDPNTVVFGLILQPSALSPLMSGLSPH